MKKRAILFWCVGIMMAVLCVFSIYKLVSYYGETNREVQAFQELSQQVSKASQKEPYASEKEQMQAVYGDLYKQNSDFFGWLRIEDTPLDYPVMYTPKEPEYYLRRAFDKTYSTSGTPFLDANCYEGSGNYLIYGHNMKSGTMFAELLSYADKSYWQQHPIVVFDTLSHHNEYAVIGAFYSEIYAEDAQGVFRYYQYTDLTNQTVFDEYVNKVHASALYDTGVSADFGDTLLTLSTCAYHTENGRFVVVAKQISDE